jgi:hypothetical protein
MYLQTDGLKGHYGSCWAAPRRGFLQDGNFRCRSDGKRIVMVALSWDYMVGMTNSVLSEGSLGQLAVTVLRRV